MQLLINDFLCCYLVIKNATPVFRFMRNNPRNVIYYYTPKDPPHHRMLSKRQHLSRSLSRSCSNSARTSRTSSKYQSTMHSVKKLEKLTSSSRPNIPQLFLPAKADSANKIDKFHSAKQPRRKIFQNSPQQQKSLSIRDIAPPKVYIFSQIASLLNVEDFNSSLSNSMASSLASNIGRQPRGDIFLCRNCYQFFSCMEEKIHNKSCFFGNSKQEYLSKWRKLRQLLQSIGKQLKDHTAMALRNEMLNQQDPILLDFTYLLRSNPLKILRNGDVAWVLQQLIVGMRSAEEEQKTMFAWVKCG